MPHLTLDSGGRFVTDFDASQFDRASVIHLASLRGKTPAEASYLPEGRKAMRCALERFEVSHVAAVVINQALLEVERITCPIMPLTDMELMAYVEELTSLECAASDMGFIKGKRYALESECYTYDSLTERIKPHHDGTLKHQCRISGPARRFVLRNEQADQITFDQPAVFWRIFRRPCVRTVAEVFADTYQRNLFRLDSIARGSGFSFYPGQMDYIARVACRDHALLAAEVGAGKSLMAINLIKLQKPSRTLIIAPQGTVRGFWNEERDYQAAQWLTELERFAPHLKAHRLFCAEDYHRLIRRTGALPDGVYVSYYQGMFINGKPETLAGFVKDQFDMIVADECHVCRNLDAQVTQGLIQMQARFRYGLSATPFYNVASDIYPILGWLAVPNWHDGNHVDASFPWPKDCVCNFDVAHMTKERDLTQEELNREADDKRRSKVKRVIPVISDPLPLVRVLKPHIAYTSKRQCNPALPYPVVRDIRVPMGKQQAALYRYWLDRNKIKHQNALTRARIQIGYLRNICADPAGFEQGGPVVASNYNPKLAVILELLRAILSEGEQAVVVCARVGQTDEIARRLLDSGVRVSRIDSSLLASKHAAQSELFKRKQTQVMLMGIKCAAAYSYPECCNLIIGSLDEPPGALAQAQGRIDRVNSRRQANIWRVLHDNSIETVMFDRVTMKADAAMLCLCGEYVQSEYQSVDWEEIVAEAMTGFQQVKQVDEAEYEARWLEMKSKLIQNKERLTI